MGFGYSGSLIVWMMLFIYFAGSFFIRCAECSCCCILAPH
ncbi:CcsA-like protein [Neisseria gonorrhoeae]|uniref:CcsA-like protein n=1 Tax=Neisseria gonorrhoeae TaxID=485 RepID=A0A379B2T0_NEIGO|nr:CcsA-like protein [Neisseria gonorrhoeae]